MRGRRGGSNAGWIGVEEVAVGEIFAGRIHVTARCYDDSSFMNHIVRQALALSSRHLTARKALCGSA
jgi:hypothetical protein